MQFGFRIPLLEFHGAAEWWRHTLAVVVGAGIARRWRRAIASQIPLRKHSSDRDRISSSRVVQKACSELGATLAALGADRRGLLQSEAEARLALVGANEIARDRPPAWYWQLLACLKNPFIGVLVLLAVVSFA